MLSSDADKPPICSPVERPLEVDAQCGQPSESNHAVGPNAGSDALDAIVETLRPNAVPRAGTFLHWTFLIMALVVVSASVTLSVRNREQVVVPIIDAPLPGTCTFRKLTGVPCPGCGLTRSFVSMGHGQMSDAWSYNPAGFFFFAIVAFQIPYRIYQIVRVRRGLGQHRFAWLDNGALLAVAVVLLIQWFWRLVASAT